MTKYGLLICLLLCVTSMQAQSGPVYRLQGRLHHFPAGLDTRLVLDSWNSDHWAGVTGLQPDAEGRFSTELRAVGAGQFRLRLLKQSDAWADFLISERETDLTIDLDYRQMQGIPAALPSSAENLRYGQLMEAHYNLYQTAVNAPELLDSLWIQYNRFCDRTAAEFSDKYLGIAARLLREAHPNDYPKEKRLIGAELLRVHGLDAVPFSKEGILYHQAFQETLDRYCLGFDTTQAERIALVDSVMAHRSGNEEVNAFLFKYLLRKLLDEYQEAAISRLVTLYTPDCSDESPLPNGVKLLIQALQNTQPGQPVPALELTGPDGQLMRLSDIFPKQKITLVLFWRTSCPHCQELEPVLAELYKKHHQQGLEVFAVSMDKDEAEWKRHLAATPTPWLHSRLPAELREDVLGRFPVASTPTLLAVDQQGKIRNRMMEWRKLEEWLGSMLH